MIFKDRNNNVYLGGKFESINALFDNYELEPGYHPSGFIVSLKDVITINTKITLPKQNRTYKTQIFPNPFYDNLNLLSTHNFNNNSKIMIYDLLGNLVYYKEFRNYYKSEITLYLNSLKYGIYEIIIKRDKQIENSIIIKKL